MSQTFKYACEFTDKISGKPRRGFAPQLFARDEAEARKKIEFMWQSSAVPGSLRIVELVRTK